MPVDQIPIGTFSHLTRLSKKALHCYDQKGLLVPATKDLCSGYRYYAIAQIDRAVRIRALSGLGFSLDEVASILDAAERGETEVLAGFMEGRRRAVQEEIGRLRRVERVLSSADPLKEMFRMSLTEWTIKEIAPLRVISARTKGTYAEVTGSRIEVLCREIASPENRSAGVKVSGTVISICYAGDEDGSDCDVEVALPVTGAVTVTYSSAYSDATPILLPYSFGSAVEADRTYYTADLDAGPIDTKHPLDTEPVLAPKGNLTPAADGRRYTYDCPLYLSCDAPAGANLTLSIRFSGSNEWWLLGWSSNAYTDQILTEIQAKDGWRSVGGTLSTGEGRYFQGEPSSSPRFFSLQSGKDQNDVR